MRTSTPDLTTPAPTRTGDISPSTEGEFHLEALTVEAAVADVRRRTGRDPEVLDVERVTRGGVGGFFAKECVRVHVRIGSPPLARATSGQGPSSERTPVAEARPKGVDGALQAMAAANDDRERDFELELRKALAEARPVAAAASASLRAPAPARVAAPTPPAAAAPAMAALPQAAREVEPGLFDRHPAGRTAATKAAPEGASTVPASVPPSPASVVQAAPERVDTEPAVVPQAIVPDPPIAPEPVAAAPVTAPVAAPAAPSEVAPVATEPTVSETPKASVAEPAGSLMSPEVIERLRGSAPAPNEASVAGEDEDVVDGELVAEEAPLTEMPRVSSPVTESVAPTPVAPSPASLAVGSPLAIARATRPGARWNTEALYAMGLPGAVIDGLDVGRGADEFVWLRAMAEAVGPWCRALPSGPSVLVGPKAAAMGNALGLTVCHKGAERVPYGGHVALVTSDSGASRAWIDDVRGERWLHLTVGGRRWEGLVAAAPKAVSVVGRARVPEALALCASFDLVLGHLLRDARDEAAIRMTPLDVALAIRDALPRAEGA